MSRQVLGEIYREMRRIFVYTTDKKQYKRLDDWRVPELSEDGKLRDDCDGFITYAHKLIREQLPDKEEVKMYPVYCKTSTGGHVVLAIEYANNTYIFDNRQTRIVTFDFLKRRDYSDFRRPKGSVSGKWYKMF
mgnify:CR=1 FL=1